MTTTMEFDRQRYSKFTWHYFAVRSSSRNKNRWYHKCVLVFRNDTPQEVSNNTPVLRYRGGFFCICAAQHVQIVIKSMHFS